MLTYDEFVRVMYPDVKIMYTYSEEPCMKAIEPYGDRVDITLQAVSKESEASRAHGYNVHKSTLYKIINELEYDSKAGADEIELCPFCKSSCHASKFDNGKWYVECGYCGTSTAPVFNTKGEAVKFWNEREV